MDLCTPYYLQYYLHALWKRTLYLIICQVCMLDHRQECRCPTVRLNRQTRQSCWRETTATVCLDCHWPLSRSQSPPLGMPEKYLTFISMGNTNTVNSAYNGSAYKELSVIRNWFSFPDLYPSLFYVKIYG